MKAMMYNSAGWIKQTDEKYLRETFTTILKESGFGIEDQIHKSFDPYGYTGLWLLSESHFAVHTFPEEGKAYIEMSSCIKEPFEMYMQILKRDRLLRFKKL